MKTNSHERLLLPDLLRGFTVISMVLYHGMWDLVWLCHVPAPWYDLLPGYVWQQSICWCFLLISGYCFVFDKKPVQRGLRIFGFGALISLVTVLFLPEERILFGVLTLIGSSVLLTVPLNRAVRGRAGSRNRQRKPCAAKEAEEGNKTSEAEAAGGAAKEGQIQETTDSGTRYKAGLILSAALFLLTRNVNRGSLGFEGLAFCHLPAVWYRNLLTAWIGFPPAEFWSTDYFSLIPWYFLYLTGYFFHLCFPDGKTERRSAGKSSTVSSVLLWVGRHAFLIYLLHQPVLFLLLRPLMK